MRKQDGARVVRAAVAMGLAGTLAMPGAAWAADGSAGALSAEKDEVVYVKAGADGATQGVYVVNVFDTATAVTVDDPGRYTRVKNLTTEDELVQRDGAVQVKTLSGEPFYYQGDLDAATVLPWDIALSYYLDGREVGPDELAGATGKVRVVLDVKARTDASANGVSDFAQSCLLQAQGTFSEESFGIEDAGDATVAHAGSNALVTCLVLPGESAMFEITGQARGFEYAGWQISALPLSMAIDLASQDTSELTGKTDQLEEATSQLSEGAGALADGLGSLNAGAQSLSSGTGEVAVGADSLANGAGSLAAGAADLAAGTNSLNDGANRAAAGAASVNDGAQKLAVSAGKLQEGAGALMEGLAQTSASSSALLGGWDQLRGSAGSLNDGAQALAAGSGQFAAGLAASKANAASAAASYDVATAAFAAAAQAAKDNPSADTVAAMNSAALALAAVSQASGAYGALSGVESSYAQVAGGISSVASGTAAMGAGAGEFDESLRAYTGAVESIATQSTELGNGVDQAVAGIGSLAAGAGEAAEGAAEVSSGAAGAARGAQSAAAGAASLAAGSSDLALGAHEAASGSAQVASGAGTVAGGAGTLANGAAELAVATKGMGQEVLDELQKAIDEKLGADFVAHSFVDPANEAVDDVQFVYVVEGVEAVDDEPDGEGGPAASEDGSTKATFIDRLLALFRPEP